MKAAVAEDEVFSCKPQQQKTKSKVVFAEVVAAEVALYEYQSFHD